MNMAKYPYAERLIVAADFAPSLTTKFPAIEVRAKVTALAEALQGLGIGLKVNSGLRAMGYDVLDDIASLGLHGFADLKLVDIEETLSTDGKFLLRYPIRYLTVMANAGVAAIKTLVDELPRVHVIPVTVLTNFNDEVCYRIYGCNVRDAVLRLAQVASDAGARDIVLSAKENASVLAEKALKHLNCNNPAIRPEWGRVKLDDQDPKRISTVTGALQAKARRLIVGRPVLNAAPNDEGLPQNPREAAIRILDEMHAFYGPTFECTE
jgi:orotidine-5'-phosphate decarboxylase